MSTYNPQVIGTTIPANEALSGAMDIGACSLVAIEMPESWAGTTITFQSKARRKEDTNPNADEESEDWDNVYDSAGNELAVVVAANRVITDIPELAPLSHIRIRSGTSATPVNQNPQKDIRLICK
jgi:hypothetical protein